MSILNLGEIALDYYDKIKPRNIVNGFEKNVLIREDANVCVFVTSDYVPKDGDVIFRCQLRNGYTDIQLYRNKTVRLLSKEEWQILLNAMNGIIIQDAMDVRQGLSFEVEDTDPELAKKIRSFSTEEASRIYSDIKKFWDREIGFDYFK